jgi:hypothetical protein
LIQVAAVPRRRAGGRRAKRTQQRTSPMRRGKILTEIETMKRLLLLKVQTLAYA